MRVNVAIPEAHVSAPVLNAALEGVTRLNESMIRAGAPTADQLIDAGAIWKPEPPGQEHFDHIGIIAKRGWADCDDWAPAKAAQLRVTGEDPGARAVVKRSGNKRWHALVKRSDGSWDDPSIDAGMPAPGARHGGVHGAALPLMFPSVSGVDGVYEATPHLALRPIADEHGQIESWQARADLPWHAQPGHSPADIALASLHQSPIPDQAIVGAVLGAFDLGCAGLDGGHSNPEHLKRMSAIADCCNGASWEELAAEYGPEHATAAGHVVGSFFGKLWKKAKKIAKVVINNPITSAALSFVPGGGIVKSALSMASPLLRGSLKRGRHKPPSQRLRRAAPGRRPRRAGRPTGFTYPRAPGGGGYGSPRVMLCYPTPPAPRGW